MKNDNWTNTKLDTQKKNKQRSKSGNFVIQIVVCKRNTIGSWQLREPRSFGKFCKPYVKVLRGSVEPWPHYSKTKEHFLGIYENETLTSRKPNARLSRETNKHCWLTKEIESNVEKKNVLFVVKHKNCITSYLWSKHARYIFSYPKKQTQNYDLWKYDEASSWKKIFFYWKMHKLWNLACDEAETI